METKICKKCGVEKPVSDFSKGGKQLRADGTLKQYYKSICQKCFNVGPRPRTDNIDPKPCSQCGEIKPLSEYGFEHSRQRYRSDCKACKYKKRLKHRSENPKVIERERKKDRWRRVNDPEYHERQKLNNRKSYQNNKDRRQKEARDKWANDHEYRKTELEKRRWRWNNIPEWKEKRKAENIKYVNEHKEELRIKSKQYQRDNKERISEYNKQFRKDNPEHCRKLAAAQYQKHKDKLLQNQRKFAN